MAASRMDSPTPNVMLPHQSTLDDRRSPSSRSERYDQTVPTTPIGTLTQKPARQDTSDSTPPTISPTKEPATAAIWLMPRAGPRRSGGKASVRIAVELAKSMD